MNKHVPKAEREMETRRRSQGSIPENEVFPFDVCLGAASFPFLLRRLEKSRLFALETPELMHSGASRAAPL
jgi:hypothetical protein